MLGHCSMRHARSVVRSCAGRLGAGRRARIGAAVSLALIAAHPAYAGTDTWLNAANDGQWDNALNWSNAAKPAATDDAVFGAGNATTIELNSGETANSLSFNDNGYILTAGSLSLTTGNISVGAGLADIVGTILAGSAGLNYSGTSTGTLTLNGGNTYTGTTTISGGTLRMTNLLALGASGAGNDTTVSSGGTLEVAVSGTVATEPLTLNGTGVNGTSGALLADNTTTWSGAITIATDSTINVIGATTIFSQSTTAMTVNGNLTKIGSGEFALSSGITTGTGALNVNAGLFTVNGGKWNSGNISVAGGATYQTIGGGSAAMGTQNITVASGGVLDWADTNAAIDTIGALTLGGTGINGNGAWINSVNNAGQIIAPSSLVLTAATTIGGLGTVATATAFTPSGFALTKSGTGAFKSTATSGQPLNDGSIVLNSGSLVLAPTAAATLTGGTAAGSTFGIAQGGGVFQFGAAAAVAVSYTFGDGSTSSITRSGNATLAIRTTAHDLGTVEQFILSTSPANQPPVVSGGNSNSKMIAPWLAGFDGVDGDFLAYVASSGFTPIVYDQTNPTAPTDPTLTAQFNAATTLTGSANAAYAVRVDNALTLPASATLAVGDGVNPAGLILNTATASIGPATATLAFGASEGIIHAFGGASNINAIISGSGGITVAGNNVLNLNGVNTYTGGTRINSGATVAFTVDANLGSTASANNTTLNGGTLDYSPPGKTNLTLNVNHGIVLGPAGGTINVIQSGGSTSLIVTGANQITGPGTLFIGNATGGNKTNGVEITAPQNYSGGTVFVTGGVDRIQLQDPNGLGTGDVHINGGEVYVAAGSTATPIPNNFFIGTTGAEGRGAIRDANGDTLAGTITLFANATVSNDHAGTVTISGSITGPYTLTLDGTASSSPTTSIMFITGVNSQAATVLNDIVNINSDAALGQANGVVTLNTGAQAATLRAAANNISLNYLRSIVLAGTGAATIDTQANSMSIFGPISGPATAVLAKAGTGNLSLAGQGTYLGGTTIGAGAVLARYLDTSPTPTGSLGTGPVSITTGGTLAGGQVIVASGTAAHVVGAITVSTGVAGSGIPGGTIAAGTPGLSGTTADLITHAQVWNGSAASDGTGGTYAWKLNLNNNSPGATYAPGTFNSNKSGANWDQLSVSALTVSGMFNVQIIGIAPGSPSSSPFNPGSSYQWVAANAPSNGVTSGSSSLVIPPPSGFSAYPNLGAFSAAFDSADDPGFTDLVITYSPAPEPTSLLLMTLGGVGLLLRRRRPAGMSTTPGEVAGA